MPSNVTVTPASTVPVPAGWRGSLETDVADARLAQALRLWEQSPEEFADTLLPTMFTSAVLRRHARALRETSL